MNAIRGLVVAVALFVILMTGVNYLAVDAAPMEQNAPNTFAGFFPRTVKNTAAAQYGPQISWAQYDGTELQYTVDQTVVNTVTLVLQYSNDGLNWVETTLATAAADTNAFTQTNALGRLARLKVTATNTNPVTVTVGAVLE